jgi:RNA polymerase sigma-B factor
LESTDVADSQLGLEELMQQSENIEMVAKVMARLPERDRKILYARYFEERDSEEVCMQFQIPREHLRVLLQRAIRRFGEKYKGELEELAEN